MADRTWNVELTRRRMLQLSAGVAGAAALTGYAGLARGTRAQSAPDFTGRRISVIAHSGHDLYLPTTVIPAFTALTGAEVEYVPIPPGDLNTRWATMAAAQDGSIDVLYGSALHAATFAGSGVYEDLTDIANPALVEGMLPATRQASEWDGRVWYLAMDSLGWIFLWNHEMYEQAGLDPTKPPETFDEFIDMSVKLTTPDRYGTHLPMNWFSYLLLFNSTGSTVLSDDNRTLNADTPEGRMVLEAMKALVDSESVQPSSYSPDVTFDAGEGFRTEQIAHYIGASSHYPRSQNPELATTVGKVTTGLVPGLVLRSGSTTGNEGFGVNGFSANKDVALAFAEFLLSDEMQPYVALEWGRGPGQQKFADDTTLLDPDLDTNQPHIATLLEQMTYPARRYQAPFHFDLDRVFTENILALVTGQQDVATTASTVQSLGQEIIDEYWASVA